ncbi:MAG: cyclic dehypoxanthinyl futalosine synthase [Syntrophales bacterium]|nr:cyclic dehypoxanthinyl futalosine synthase [Syntrophales bacterium]
MLPAIYVKIRNRERISREEGLFLLRRAELLDLAERANEIRFEQNPTTQVTFVVDSNPNYTNICENDCLFCAFRRHPTEGDAYAHTVDQMIRRFKDAAAKGATTILLQGGVNPALTFDYYLEMVKRTIAEVPGVHPHFYSPPEIIGMSRISGLSLPEVLEKLWDAGMRTIPGGGAEVLSDRVKEKISKKKGTSENWLRVMREAHRIGYKSTATMMYGHLETDEDILNHLESIRQLQDEHQGFTAFISWSFKPGNTPLVKTITQRATATRYLQIIALSRIYLDNFPHIQASWFSEGKKTGQIALHFGADDFGGTLLEENVHAAADFINRTDIGECVQMIHDAGFDAAQRSTLYEIIKVFPRSERALYQMGN